MFRAQYIPDFFVAEHYGLRNTTSLHGGLRISPQYKVHHATAVGYPTSFQIVFYEV
jgi:hypothetical protein